MGGSRRLAVSRRLLRRSWLRVRRESTDVRMADLRGHLFTDNWDFLRIAGGYRAAQKVVKEKASHGQESSENQVRLPFMDFIMHFGIRVLD